MPSAEQFLKQLSDIAHGRHVNPKTGLADPPNRPLRNFLTHHYMDRVENGVPVWQRLNTFYSTGPGSKGRGRGGRPPAAALVYM